MKSLFGKKEDTRLLGLTVKLNFHYQKVISSGQEVLTTDDMKLARDASYSRSACSVQSISGAFVEQGFSKDCERQWTK